MRDYKRLRKVLQRIASDPNDGRVLTVVTAERYQEWAKEALADTPEESEMERLREWLEEHLLANLENADDYAQGQHVFVEYALAYIQSELGGEDAE